MMQRCYNENTKWYHNYGGRGVTVCEAWHKSENFIADMGEPPFKGATLERLNNDLGYSPDNCVWADRQTQTENRRTTKLNRASVEQIKQLIAEGVLLKDIAKKFGVSSSIISNIKAGRIWKD